MAIGGVLLLVAATLGGCGGGSNDPNAAQTRQVLVDYSHDEMAASLFNYFPNHITMRPGDTIEFKQAWQGEPHSVTMGKLVDEQVKPIIGLLDRIRKSGVFPKEDPPEFSEFSLPFALGEADDPIFQQAAQPCYVEEAATVKDLPGDATHGCPHRDQVQPAFADQAYYSSGIIPFQGVGGNTFRVDLADDLAPGTYTFFCDVHGPLQYGQIEVVPKGKPIPSAAAVAKEARNEAEAQIAPLLREWRKGKRGEPVTGGDIGSEPVTYDPKKTNLIGVPSPTFENHQFFHAYVLEFLPKHLRAKVGEKVTWTTMGTHTLSFNVPRYVPVFTIEKDGRYVLNPTVYKPLVWPGPPEQPAQDASDGGDEAPPKPVDVAVTWDGTGFVSTGLDYPAGSTFTVTFTKPGHYPFACLLHPRMVGDIDVSA
jgi:plastocyanin